MTGPIPYAIFLTSYFVEGQTWKIWMFFTLYYIKGCYLDLL